MAARQGKCIQFGACSKADNKEVIELQAGEDFICQECGKPLQEIQADGRGGSRNKILAVVVLFVAALAGIGGWILFHRNPYPPLPPEDGKGVTGSQPPVGSPPGPAASGQNAVVCGLQPIGQPDVNRLLTYLKQGMTYAAQNRYELALKEFEQVRRIDPNFLAMHENIAAAQIRLRNLAEAEAHLREELKLIDCLDQARDTELPPFAYMLETGRDAAGDREQARAETMRERLRQARSVAHYNMACLKAVQGNTDDALAELQRAVDNGFSDTAALRRDPDLARIRSTPAFRQVMEIASSKGQTTGRK